MEISEKVGRTVVRRAVCNRGGYTFRVCAQINSEHCVQRPPLLNRARQLVDNPPVWFFLRQLLFWGFYSASCTVRAVRSACGRLASVKHYKTFTIFNMGYCALVQYVNCFCMLIRVGETKKSWGLFGDLRYKNLTKQCKMGNKQHYYG
jgi:hypothetical protein